MMNKLKERILYPISEDLIFLILIWLMISGPEFLIQTTTGHFLSGILFVVIGLGVSYILVFIVDYINRITKILRPMLFVYLALYTLLNIYFIYRYHTRLNINFLDIIAGTNPGEIREYLQMYVGLKEYAGIILYILMMCILYWISNHHINNKIKIAPIVPVVIIATSVLAFFINPALKGEIPLWNFNIEDIADLRKYQSDNELEFHNDSLPETVVVILGESHSPRKTSLYGYDLQTSPLLSERNKKGNFIVFENVKSPCTNTSQAFRYILNTKIYGDNDETPWYKTSHLVDVLNKAGYNTLWISNQARRGVYNNLSSSSADLCDSAIFLRNFWDDKIYDGELPDVAPDTTYKKNAVFYHLMGQHILFKERFPESFSFFTADDYPGQKDVKKKEMLADYDNATLYNDYVIDKIIRKYEDSEAIIFYFADHGLDIYESDKDYCGHARQEAKSQQLGREVPFYVFISEKYKQKFPQLSERIKMSKSKDFTTDKFIFSALDALNIKFADSNSVRENSLFSD